MLPLLAHETVTIEECVGKALDNYPIIKKYKLVEATNEIDLSDISKIWLPRISVYGQATLQNIVPSFPETLTNVLQQMGQEMKGISKAQYKIGVDLNQTIWDGGVSAARREITRQQAENERSALDVEIYSVRQRVENIYFAILLTEQQLKQNEITLEVLRSNSDKLKAMFRNGVATQADVDMVEAQILSLRQIMTQAQCAVKGYRDVLALYTGESLDGKKLIMPQAFEPEGNISERPELQLFRNRLKLNKIQKRLSDTSIMPKVGFFAQAYYGYPGFDYFKSMMNRELSFNIMAGVRVTWNIDSFYTRSNNDKKRALEALSIETDKDLFLFNTNLQSASWRESINGIRQLMKDDSKIIQLRENVRKAAESQLDNGIIDATTLITKISEESSARCNLKLHEIQLLQEIYKLKYTLNR